MGHIRTYFLGKVLADIVKRKLLAWQMIHNLAMNLEKLGIFIISPLMTLCYDFVSKGSRHFEELLNNLLVAKKFQIKYKIKIYECLSSSE